MDPLDNPEVEGISSQQAYHVQQIVLDKTEFLQVSQLALINLDQLILKLLNSMPIERQEIELLLKQITYLNNLSNISIIISMNNLYEIPFVSSCISKLQNLHSLDLNFAYSQIQNEQALNLSLAISTLSRLQTLSITFKFNEISDFGVQSILINLGSLAQLSNLSLNFSNMDILKTSVAPLQESLPKLKNLFNLSLHFVQLYLSNEGVHSISKGISHLNNLKALNIFISDIKMGKSGEESLISAISHLEKLQTLDLKLFDYDIQGFQLKDYNKISQLCELKTLKLHLLSIILFGKKQIMQNSFVISELSSLQFLELYIMNTNILSNGFESISQTLSKLLNLQTLKLIISSCEIAEPGMELLAGGIAKLTTLDNLHLELNSTTGRGTIHLFQCFQDLVNLQSLLIKFTEDHIMRDYIDYLAKSLLKLTVLKDFKLILSGEKHNLSFESLWQTLPLLLNLKSLSLHFYHFSIEEINSQILAGELAKMVNLQELGICLFLTGKEFNWNFLIKKLKKLNRLLFFQSYPVLAPSTKALLMKQHSKLVKILN